MSAAAAFVAAFLLSAQLACAVSLRQQRGTEELFPNVLARLPSSFALPWPSFFNDRPLLFIGINSAPHNVQQRMEIRNSWMKYECLQGPKPRVYARFIIGQTDAGSDVEKALAAEENQYSDFVRLPVVDSYHNLVNKTIAYFNWFAQYCQSEFVMKIDDDTYPNLRRLVSILEAHVKNKKKFTYAGDLLSHNRMLTWGKWAQNPEVYNETFYPVYAAGPAYILQRDLARRVFLDNFEVHRNQILDNEDTNVGLWVHMENRTGTQVNYNVLDSQEEGCSPGVVFAMNLQENKMSCMWGNKLANKSNLCCDVQHTSWQQRNAVSLFRQRARDRARRLIGQPRDIRLLEE